MLKIIKFFIVSLLLFSFVRPVLAVSQTANINSNVNQTIVTHSAQAQVLKVLQERIITRNNGAKSKQQNLQLKILTGPLTGKLVKYQGISKLDVVGNNVYKAGDKVVVNYSAGLNGQNTFYIMNYIRENSLWWLLLLFIVVILLIGRSQGLKAILSLSLSFVFIIKVMIPLIIQGFNPLLVGGLGSFVILLIIVYLTNGINKKSHIALLSILISLIVTAGLAIFFSNLAHLTGTAQEEVTYLIEAGPAINFQGLLLAAIIIGTLGILDDIVIGQVEVVTQIRSLNPRLPFKKTFTMSMKVGRAHLGAVVNTLFLAYVGMSLPLIVLIGLHQTPFLSFFQIVNSEKISTEIVRTLVGVIGLSLSVPITTWLAARYLQGDKKLKQKVNNN